MSENPGIIPVFQDEVHFQAQTSIMRTWAPKGSRPKVMSKPGKNKIAYSGFVIPSTGELYVTNPVGSTTNPSYNLSAISSNPILYQMGKGTA